MQVFIFIPKYEVNITIIATEFVLEVAKIMQLQN